ncbi:MAG: helix-turn-helix transcriptional regulator [Bacillota bacterium]
MKIDRLLGIITVLLQRGKATAPELAGMFEVSRRTIQRDIDHICQAGIPLVTYQGGGGGVAIADSFKLDKSVLSVDELESIIAGLRSLGSVSKSTRIKHLINRLAPQGEAVVSIKDSVLIDLSSHYRTSLSDKIALLKEAIRERKMVSFDYYSEKGMTKRTVEPYVILFRWTAWYLLGYCCERSGFRLFKLNRLWNCWMTAEAFSPKEVPAEQLDVGEYFANGSMITILFDRSVEYILVEDYGPGSYEATEDGRLSLTVPYTNKSYILSWVLGFADKAEVVAPAELVAEIRDLARKTILRYEHDR